MINDVVRLGESVLKAVECLYESAEGIECEVQMECLGRKLIEYDLEHCGVDYDEGLVDKILYNGYYSKRSMYDVTRDVIQGVGDELLEVDEIKRLLLEEQTV